MINWQIICNNVFNTFWSWLWISIVYYCSKHATQYCRLQNLNKPIRKHSTLTLKILSYSTSILICCVLAFCLSPDLGMYSKDERPLNLAYRVNEFIPTTNQWMTDWATMFFQIFLPTVIGIYQAFRIEINGLLSIKT